MKQTGTRSILDHFLTLGCGTVLYLLIGFIGTPIITRLIAPEDYGQLSMLTVYSQIGMMLCGLGLDQTLVRYFYQAHHVSEQKALLRTCCGLPFLSALLFGGLLMAAAASPIDGLPLLELVLLEANILALLAHRYAMLILRLRYHTKVYSTLQILQKSAYILLTVGLVLWTRIDHGLILAAATIASTLLAALLGILYEKDLWTPARHVLPWKTVELLKYGFPILLSSGINKLFQGLDRFFLEHFCTMSDVGIYASAMSLTAVFSVLRTSFNALWIPSAVEHYEHDPNDRSYYQRGNACISVLMLSFGAVIVLCKDLFVLLLGQDYQAASQVLPYLMFEPILYTISETTVTGIVISKKSSYQVLAAAGACLVNFLGNWWLTPLLGPQGAALSTCVSYVVFFMLRTALANRVFYVDYQLPRFAIALIALLLFAAYSSNHSFSWCQIPMFLGVMAAISVCYRHDLQFMFRFALPKFQSLLQRR